MEAAFALGDYPTVISRIEENEEISSGRKKSLLVRSLLLSDQGEYAQGLLNSDSSLDRALAVYARAVVQSTSSTTDWKFIEAEAMVVGDYEGTELRDETAIVLSRTYALSGNLQAAYRLAAQTPSLEAQCLLITYLCRINRADLAFRKIEKLRLDLEKINYPDFEIILSLAEAESLVSNGKAKEALYIYQEAMQIYGRSQFLLHALSTCNLLLGKWSDAESFIQESLHLNPQDPIALSHLLMLSSNRGASSDVLNDQESRLKQADPSSVLLAECQNAVSELQKAVATTVTNIL